MRRLPGWSLRQTLSESALLRYVVLTALYVGQGLPWGFISVGYVVFLADQGLGAEAVGAAIGWAYVPWSFKFLFGPMLDRVGVTRWGRRRPFIIGAEAMMGVTLLALLVIDPAANLGLVAAILFAHNTAAALQDVAVDALAVEILPENERGRANAYMWAGKSAGVAIGGGGGTWLSQYLGWPGLLIVLALLIWAIMALPVLFHERRAGEAPPIPGRFDWPTLKRSFGFWTPWAGLLIGLVTPVGYAMVGTTYTRMLRADLEFDENRIAFLTGIVDPITGIVGALIGGWLADKVGARRAMAFGMMGIGLVLAGFGLSEAWWPSIVFLTVYTAALNLCISSYNSASFGFFMGLSNPAIGATHYAGYMAVTNLTYAWTSPAGGWVADNYDVPTLFLGAAVAQILAIALLPLANPALARARYAGVGSVAGAGRAPVG